MEKWKIWTIIGIMSFSLIGVALSQIYWIKWSISLDEKNFDDNVFRALNEVRQQVDNDIKNPNYILDVLKDKLQEENNSYLKKIQNSTSKWRKTQILNETRSLTYSLNPDIYLENIEPKRIDNYLKEALKNRGIDLDFSYGIYSNKNKGFIIINDHYVSPEKDANFSKSPLDKENISNTKYEVQLLNTEFKSPGSLKLYFQNKAGWIWYNILPTLLLNLLFTLLILIGFSYTIYIIFKQKKISQIKTDFVNNMTHEFKTPIATISLATDSILSPVIFNDKEKVKKFVNIIQEENSRLLDQVEKVLQIAKLDKRKIQLSFSEINIHQLLDETIDHLELKLKDKNGKIIKKYNAKDQVIEGDETHLINIFNNIFENAIKYSLENPEIYVETHNTKKGIEVIIKDKGIGMTKNEINHIFDKFYRVPTGNIHNIKGFGLGLAYVKTFVEAHKGKISVKSSKGKGSEFKINLPKNVT